MTRLTISPSFLEKWMRQNEAEYTGDFFDGALIDSFVVFCKRGVAAIYEHYINSWESDYRVEFETGRAKTVWENWNRFAEASKHDVA